MNDPARASHTSPPEPLAPPSDPPLARFHTFVAVTIRALRRRYRLHPHEVARHVGLSDAQWARVESGRSIPTPNHLHAVAELLLIRHSAPDTPSAAGILSLAERVVAGALVGSPELPALAVLAMTKVDELKPLTRQQLTALRRLADRIVEHEVSAPIGLELDNVHLDDVDDEEEEEVEGG